MLAKVCSTHAHAHTALWSASFPNITSMSATDSYHMTDAKLQDWIDLPIAVVVIRVFLELLEKV